MDNRFLLSDELGEIDSKFLDEYYENRRRRAVRRNSIVKYAGIVASVTVVITLSLILMLPMFRTSPTSNPADTLNVTLDNTENESVGGESSVPETDNNKFNKEEHTKPNYNDYTVIYAEEKDDSLGYTVEDEVYIEPPKPGEVRFSGELYDIVKSDGLYENTLFAIEMAFNSEFDVSDEYISSLGLELKNVKVIWNDDPEMVDEFTTVWDVRFTYLTKEQLVSFDAPDDIGVELKLIPRWMDTGEDVIYRSQDFYPITIE